MRTIWKNRKCCAEQTSGSGKGRIQRQGISEGFSSCDLQKADVTTGALYFFFESKAALFEEIVKETVEKLKELTGDFSNRENSCCQKNMTEFLWNLSGKPGYRKNPYGWSGRNSI